MGKWIQLQQGSWRVPEGLCDSRLLVNCVGCCDLGSSIRSLIQSAQESVCVISPLVVDTRVVSDLVDARNRHCRVKVLTNLVKFEKPKPNSDHDAVKVKYPTKGFEELFHADHLHEQFRAIRTLAEKRIQSRSPRYYVHPKLVIADANAAIISSANLAPNNLGWGDNPSVEAGLRQNDAPIVQILYQTFQTFWNNCQRRFHLLDQDVSLQEDGTACAGVSKLAATFSDGMSLDWTYPPRHRGLRDRLVHAIRQADKQIILVAMSFFETDRIRGLQDSLQNAIDRGVEVIVIVRRNHFEDDRYPDASTYKLLAKGMTLLGIRGLHIKGFLIDRALCGMMSANINHFSLDSDIESANVECGIVGPAVGSFLAPYADLLDRLPASATHVYKV